MPLAVKIFPIERVCAVIVNWTQRFKDCIVANGEKLRERCFFCNDIYGKTKNYFQLY